MSLTALKIDTITRSEHRMGSTQKFVDDKPQQRVGNQDEKTLPFTSSIHSPPSQASCDIQGTGSELSANSPTVFVDLQVSSCRT
jgi:hypothetical protein